jgi:spermidine synthase
LIYEIVWFQVLELVAGSTAVSVAVLLGTFMGGMCLGSLLFPRLVPAGFRPLRAYALVELGIGVLGILVLHVMPLVGGVYTAWSGYGLPGFLLRGAAAATCLLAPSLLMGATLPALARCVEGAARGISWLGFLYAANIAGAVLGCLASGFYLLREFDVTTATYVAVTVNLIIGVVATAAGGIAPPAGDLFEEERAGESPAPPFAIYTAIALSGFCALAAEAIWTRVLSLLLGASVYTFSIILAVFLAGLGIGSGIGSLLCRMLARPRLALGWCQWLAAGAIAWTAYNLAASLPYWPIDPAIASNIWFNFQLDFARAFRALFPPTLLWGASFPLALAAAAAKGQDGGRLMARIYSANTVGAIAGALAATLVLMAWIGSQHAAQLLIAVSILAGLVLVPAALAPRAAAVATLLALAWGGWLVESVPPVSKLLIAHGRYAASWAGKGDILYAGEGVNSSVAVSSFPNGVRTFHVAGKIQASSAPRDMRLQRMLGHLTTLTAAHPDSVLVIGCGAGITAGAVSIDPRVKHETIVEIEPLVPEAASTYFSGPNFGVLRNPKVQVRIDDGRHYLMTTRERFDGITVDPLDPWVKGAANLYTQEFLEVMKEHLNAGGTVTMYVQLFETNLDAVKSAVATFFEVFPDGTIWGNPYEGKGHDMVLFGQTEPLRIDLDEMEERAGYRGGSSRMARSLAEVGMNSPEDLFATYAGRRSNLKTWLRGAAINRDRNLRMQYLAGFGLDLDEAAKIYAGMLAYRRFPDDIFVGTEGRVDSLRRAILNSP